MVDGWWLMVDGWWLMVDGWWVMVDGYLKGLDHVLHSITFNIIFHSLTYRLDTSADALGSLYMLLKDGYGDAFTLFANRVVADVCTGWIGVGIGIGIGIEMDSSPYLYLSPHRSRLIIIWIRYLPPSLPLSSFKIVIKSTFKCKTRWMLPSLMSMPLSMSSTWPVLLCLMISSKPSLKLKWHCSRAKVFNSKSIMLTRKRTRFFNRVYKQPVSSVRYLIHWSSSLFIFYSWSLFLWVFFFRCASQCFCFRHWVSNSFWCSTNQELGGCRSSCLLICQTNTAVHGWRVDSICVVGHFSTICVTQNYQYPHSYSLVVITIVLFLLLVVGWLLEFSYWCLVVLW